MTASCGKMQVAGPKLRDARIRREGIGHARRGSMTLQTPRSWNSRAEESKRGASSEGRICVVPGGLATLGAPLPP